MFGKPVGVANHRHGGLKNHGLPTHAPQLRHRPGMVAWFAQGFAMQIGHLVGPDDHGVGMVLRHRLRLGHGQAFGQRLGRFTWLRGFVHLRADHLKRQAQALRAVCRMAGVPLIINDDVALAAAVGADGVLSPLATPTVATGTDPSARAMTPDGRFLYVSNEDNAEMTVLDVTSGEILKHVKIGEEPEGVRVRPDGQVVYVTCEGTNEVAVVDTTTYAVIGHLKMEGRPRAIEFTPDGRTAFVSNENGGSVSVVDAQAHKVTGVIAIPADPAAPTPPRPMGLALSPDAKFLYVSNRGIYHDRAKDAVSIVDMATKKVVGGWKIPGGGSPDMGGVSADGKVLWLSGRYDAEVYAFDTGFVCHARSIDARSLHSRPAARILNPRQGRFTCRTTAVIRPGSPARYSSSTGKSPRPRSTCA